MTETVYAVIDNHRNGHKTSYNFMFKTKDYKAFEAYLQAKGLN